MADTLLQVMNITLELQKLDDLIIRHTSPPVTTILRNQLHPLREQMEAYVTEKENVALLLEKAQTENQKLIAAVTRSQSPNLDPISRSILKFFFDRAENVSGRDVERQFRLQTSVSDYHVDALLKQKFITQTRLGGDSASCWFAITGEGRDFIMKTMV